MYTFSTCIFYLVINQTAEWSFVGHVVHQVGSCICHSCISLFDRVSSFVSILCLYYLLTL